ncbi:unnamed protein product, partial [Owenia fusiformis]
VIESAAASVDERKCIICQKDDSNTVTSTKNGRERIIESAQIRCDDVSDRLNHVDTNSFVYHMSNNCYKQYTNTTKLRNIQKKQLETLPSQDESPRKRQRLRSSISHCQQIPKGPEIYDQKCVICGTKKHHGKYEKFRISEERRASSFLSAAVFFQDEVFTRCSNIEDTAGVFGA